MGKRGMAVAVGMAGLALATGGGAARGADGLPGTLPTLALQPAPDPSLWTGLYVGTEVIGFSGRYAKGFGGDAYAGYSHEFANKVVLAVQGTTGFLPGSGRSGFKGLDFAGADVKVGYDMGRFLPFVTAGVAAAKLHAGPGQGFGGDDTLNALLNGDGQHFTVSRVGVGVDYAVTNNLTVGVAVSAINGRTPLLP